MVAVAAPPDWAIRTAADRRALVDGYYWDQAAADRIIRFAETFVSPKYTTGAFQLFDWQRRFLMSLYGWRRPDGGRRFTSALLHVAKKNGKTLLVSILALYELYAAGEPSPLVISASTTKQNATQVFEQLKSTIEKQKKLQRITKVTESEKLLEVQKLGAEYWSMSSDAPGAEGWNISFGIVDEAHAHRSPKLYRTLEHGTSGRVNGLLVVISTAGDDLEHFYYGLLVRARRLLSGEDLDPTTYAEVYEPAPDADPDDPATWKAGNPSLDRYAGFTSERFRLAWEKAKQQTADRLNFLRYRMNLFTRSEDTVWVDVARWDQLVTRIPDDVLKAAPSWLGFDGSATTDPTSLTQCWLLPGKRFHLRSWAWVAEAGVRYREASNLPKYAQFVADGWMRITAGDMIDKELIKRHILDLRDAGYQIRGVVMDINGAHVFGNELANEGFDVSRMPQSFRYYTDPMREFQSGVAAGTITHDGNSWLRYCLHSVRVDTDRQNNIRPVKGRSVDHIDGAVSGLMAFCWANQESAKPPEKPSVYKSRGFLTL